MKSLRYASNVARALVLLIPLVAMSFAVWAVVHSYTMPTAALAVGACVLWWLLWEWSMWSLLAGPGSPWHRSGIYVYEFDMGGATEWFAGRSDKEITTYIETWYREQQCWEQLLEDNDGKPPVVTRLTGEQLDTLQFMRERGGKWSFRMELAHRLAAHETFPQMFASSEY